jgi:hypothetical protein
LQNGALNDENSFIAGDLGKLQALLRRYRRVPRQKGGALSALRHVFFEEYTEEEK